MTPESPIILEAEAVLDGGGAAYSPGAVMIRADRIASIGEPGKVAQTGAERRSYPGAIIIPGLVNAHCHLDLSFLRAPLAFNGSFLQWLMKVGWARSRASAEQCEDAARRGLADLAASGVTAVGDITTVEGGYRAVRDSGLRGVVYFETLGFKQERVDGERRKLNHLLDRYEPSDRVAAGVSPHAPYTVGPRLWRMLHEEFRPRVGRFSIHVSEILEEAAFLEGGWGPFRAVLRAAGLLEGDWEPPHLSPLEYVDSFGFVSPGTSLVHANFLTAADRKLLGERQEEGAVCVVHCPRSHRFFRRLPFPLAEFRAEGVPVALGTDSLASNQSLDMLEEMKTLRVDHPDLPPGDIVRIATLHGAQALGIDAVTGTLEPGKSADLAVIDVAGTSLSAAPAERVLAASSGCILTVVEGQVVFAR